MKKLSLLIGTLGGATAGYLFSNKTLREKIANAKDGEEAAKLLGSALQKDGKKLAKQVQEFIDSDEVQNNVTKAKKFAEKKVSEAKKELNAGKSQVKKSVATAGKKVEKSAKKINGVLDFLRQSPPHACSLSRRFVNQWRGV